MQHEDSLILSVSVICYNQKDYIGQAIDSVLSQKTKFKYEIVLSDDCSTDGTDLICKEYADKYPDIIRLIKRKKNIGGVRNYIENYTLCNGKYVAFLEGDDFFIDPYKLQKQVDFLENHEDYVICAGNVRITNSKGEILERLIDLEEGTYTVEDLCEGDFISTPTCVMRNKLLKEIPEWIYKLNGCDWAFDIINARHGKIMFINEDLAAYRIHAQGEWNKLNSLQKNREVLHVTQALNDGLNYEFTDIFTPIINSAKNTIEYLKSEKKSYRALKFIKDNKFFFLKKTFYRTTINRLLRRYLYRFDYENNAEYNNRVGEYINHIKYLQDISKQSYNTDLLILDDSYPIKMSGFRFSEFNEYLNHFKNSMVFTTGGLLYFFKDIERNKYELVNNYLKKHPEYSEKLRLFEKDIKINAKLAVLIFCSNAYNFLPFLEKNNIPFVFTIYPGGGFETTKKALPKLRKIMNSKLFRKVIVTQKIIYNYLIDNNLCEKDKIEYIHGGVVIESEFDNLSKKKYYNKDKDTLDICFVSNKYIEKGVDKGYDKFIEAAHILAEKHNNIMFHVVGPWTKDDINVSSIKKRIKFYGVKKYEWFNEFYKDKDIIISPNKPFVLGPGCFDGFPLTCSLDAMLNGVIALCSDNLKENVYYKDKEDMVIIESNSEDIVKNVLNLYNNPNLIKKIGNNGRKTTRKYYSYENQIGKRIKILEDVMNNKLN